MAEELEKQEGQEQEVTTEGEVEEELDPKAVAQKIQELEEKVQTYESLLAQMQQQRSSLEPDDYVEIPEPEEYESPFESLDEEELEGLPRKQFVKMLKEDLKAEITQRVLPSAISELDSRLNEISQATAELIVRTQIEEARRKYPDFDNYRPIMRELAQRYPNLSVEDLYGLAKFGQKPPGMPGVPGQPGQASRILTKKSLTLKKSRKPESVKPKQEYSNFRETLEDVWDEVMGGSGE